MKDLRLITKNAPKAPGVYIWSGKNKEVLYVGRASSLKQRLANYFQKDLDIRIAEMVSLATNLSYIVCDSFLEAVVLEASLIKKYWAKYNIKDRDDRSFIYAVLDKNDKWPTIKIIRGRELDKYKGKRISIFGPYQSYRLLDNALRIVRRIFPYSTCKPETGKPCFDRQIGLCPGACTGEISHGDYLKNIKHLELFLAGDKKRLLARLIKENPDRIKALKHIQDVSLLQREEIKNFPFSRIEGYDISHLSGKEVYGSMTVMTDGEIDKKEYRLFKISQQENNDFAALKEVLERRLKHKEWPRPDLLLIDGGRPQLRELKKLNIKIPIVGLSKIAGDELVFSSGTDKILKERIIDIKLDLQALRDEAHRFVVAAGRRARRIK